MNSRSFRALLLALCLAFLPAAFAQADTLDINSASADQLSSVMVGVGPAKAKAIVEYREANGRFSSVDDLTSVKGIGTATVDKNRELISVSAPPEK